MENETLYQIFECFTVLFETFIVHQYISGLFAKRDEKNNDIIWYAIFCLGLILLSLSLRAGIMLIVYTLVAVYVLVARIYKTSIPSRVFAVLYFAAIMMAAEILTTGLVSGLGKIELPNMFEYGLPRVLCIVVTKLLQIFLVKVSVSIVKIRTNPSAKTEFKMMLPLLLCQVFSIALAHHLTMIALDIYSEVKIEPVDLCILLGNLFDNALEACMLLPYESNNSITMSIVQRNNALSIRVENSYSPKTTPRWRPGKHGFGLKNVQQVVNKYNGQVSISKENCIFNVSILIP